MTPQPQPFNRTSFITLNSNRLFTAKEVAYLIKEYTPRPAPSRNILDTDLCVCGLTEMKCKAKEATIRKDVIEELWKFCLINGAEQHGDIIGLPADPFFPLKLLKKIAKMRYESSLRREVHP